LRELEPLPRPGAPGFLTLDHPRIACQQTLLAQLAAVALVREDERTADRHPERPRLPGQTPTGDDGAHVECPQGVGGGERLLAVRDQRRAGEVVAERAPVDVPLARARCEV